MNTDTAFLEEAVTLAWRAAGRTVPNPMVGAVLVRDGVVLSRGWHKGPGTPHAEVMALAGAGAAARGATAYVSLEPCNHYGSTPPCTKALVEAGVSRVVYAVADPNPVAAGGHGTLKAAGIAVDHVPLRTADDLVRPWIHSLTSDSPFVYAKLAMSLDGRTATSSGDSKWITGPRARARGHDLRQQTDAIIVGVGTVLADDPGLDARPEGQSPVPGTKVVLDTHLRTPPTSKFLSTPGDALIVSGQNAPEGRRAALEEAGAEVAKTDVTKGRPDLADVLGILKARGCQSVLIEGGSTVLGAAFDASLVDEVWAFIAPIIIGGGQPAIGGRGIDILADSLRIDPLTVEKMESDILLRGPVIRKGC